jgi:SAM-dependent methyltransferase
MNLARSYRKRAAELRRFVAGKDVGTKDVGTTDLGAKNIGIKEPVDAPAPEPTRPVITGRPIGRERDEIDALHVQDSFENPEIWEKTLRRVFLDAQSDPELAKCLRDNHLVENREEAFASFDGSGIPQAITRFASRFGICQDSVVCDLGCGPGQMTYALRKMGFRHVTAMDPNGEWLTGTGYLKSLDLGVEIVNDLAEWRQTYHRFDAIFSQATIHHWQHIPLVAIDARRALKPGGYWFASREAYANYPAEFMRSLVNHMIASRYGSYEWSYPASAYVDLIQSVGFELVAVAPWFYDKDSIIGVTREAPLDADALDTLVNDVGSGRSVEEFWKEVDHFRRSDHGHRVFTQPQMLVFRRIGI